VLSRFFERMFRRLRFALRGFTNGINGLMGLWAAWSVATNIHQCWL
jgi:hypothetical protein